MILLNVFWENVFQNLIASFIFLFLVLFLFKPKLIIGKKISKTRYIDGNEYYFFKMINISLFSAYDIEIELLEVDRYTGPNGQMNDRLRPLSVVLSKVSHIPGYRPSWLRSNAPYAIRFRSSEDLSTILNDDYKLVRVKISLRHGLTGLVKVVTKDYDDASQIFNGKFGYGLKFA